MCVEASHDATRHRADAHVPAPHVPPCDRSEMVAPSRTRSHRCRLRALRAARQRGAFAGRPIRGLELVNDRWGQLGSPRASSATSAPIPTRSAPSSSGSSSDHHCIRPRRASRRPKPRHARSAARPPSSCSRSAGRSLRSPAGSASWRAGSSGASQAAPRRALVFHGHKGLVPLRSARVAGPGGRRGLCGWNTSGRALPGDALDSART
jgi:hypothetical protein